MKWMVLVLLAAVAWPETTSAADCSFPEYLKQRPRWEGRITYARRKTKVYWKFYEDTVEMIDYSAPRPERFEEKCEEQLPGHKFLLSEVDGKIEKYVCMQFIRRSDHVVQIKTSDRSPDRSLALCDDENLLMDDWPLVWPKADEKFQACPLSGGFDFYITDHTRGTTMCKDSFLLPHIESECMSGEGINLDFRHFECRGELDMELVNDFVCLGSWEVDGYMFSVLTDRDEFWPKLWMLRYPTAQGASFDAKLMSDIVADTGDTILSTKQYYTLHMKRTIYPSLCSDESGVCDGECGKADTYFCQKTCAKCDDGEAVPKCSFPAEAKGEWMEMSDQRSRGITVTTSMMYAEDFLPLQCYDLNTQAWFEGDGRRAVATLFKNGCRPRYTCVQFQRVSDSVLHYRLSQNLIWPHSLSITAQQVCDDANFKDDLPPLQDRIRSEHPKALIKSVGMNGKRELMDCGVRKFLNLEAKMKGSDYKCSSMMNTCYSNTSFSVDMGPDCSYTGESELSSYGCLASWAAGNDHFIISENKENPKDIKCWIFHRDTWNLRPTTKVYLMHPSDCHSEAAANILYRNGTNYLIEFDVMVDEGEDIVGDSCPSGDTTQSPHQETTRLAHHPHHHETTRAPARETHRTTDRFLHLTSRVLPGLPKSQKPPLFQPGENGIDLRGVPSAKKQQLSGGMKPSVNPTAVILLAIIYWLY